ncbi:MAG: component of SufBCD complex [Salibaculum sp.]|uniref:component of SufBCD complex n=1 Tax=Salibaculum sp. TaxID=2855480 RepID=UPI002870560D|nr:component of SufBCD complex [Salibaculum sp.]MDR9427334.1 component of SufBCD complex [Salibaculum sp.]MDR9483048.1 component of SufBCD complex [Salibaculum sp.]
MNWTTTLFEVIDMRSFSNLWFWIGLAVIWSSASHWVLGVPHDMITRARRHGGKAQDDLELLVRINVDRLLHIAQVSGLVLLGSLAFVLTSLAILAFWYGVEFAQATFLLALPLSIVGALSLAAARRIAREQPAGDDLHRHLIRQRVTTQVIGMISIFVTAMFGMYQNLAVSPGF